MGDGGRHRPASSRLLVEQTLAEDVAVGAAQRDTGGRCRQLAAGAIALPRYNMTLMTTLAGIALVLALAVVSLAAVYLPVRRAAAVQPIEALRVE